MQVYFTSYSKLSFVGATAVVPNTVKFYTSEFAAAAAPALLPPPRKSPDKKLTGVSVSTRDGGLICGGASTMAWSVTGSHLAASGLQKGGRFF